MKMDHGVDSLTKGIARVPCLDAAATPAYTLAALACCWVSLRSRCRISAT
jgi:hypothetical protein